MENGAEERPRAAGEPSEGCEAILYEGELDLTAQLLQR